MKSHLSIFAFIFFLFFLVSSLALSQDPQGPDTLFIDCTPPDYSAAESMKVSFDLKLKTDNNGPGSDITRMTVPLMITVSNNLKAKVRIDTTAGQVFYGTAISGWNTKRVTVSSYGGNPALFPMDLNLGAVKSSSGLSGPGTYTLANLKFIVKDTCTICIDTGFGEVPVCLAVNGGACYTPKFVKRCCRVSSGNGLCLAVAGDCDEDGVLAIADLVLLTNVLFKGVQAPIPTCRADYNGDGRITFLDVVYAINFHFKFGPYPKKTGVCCL